MFSLDLIVSEARNNVYFVFAPPISQGTPHVRRKWSGVQAAGQRSFTTMCSGRSSTCPGRRRRARADTWTSSACAARACPTSPPPWGRGQRALGPRPPHRWTNWIASTDPLLSPHLCSYPAMTAEISEEDICVFCYGWNWAQCWQHHCHRLIYYHGWCACLDMPIYAGTASCFR